MLIALNLCRYPENYINLGLIVKNIITQTEAHKRDSLIFKLLTKSQTFFNFPSSLSILCLFMKMKVAPVGAGGLKMG